MGINPWIGATLRLFDEHTEVRWLMKFREILCVKFRRKISKDEHPLTTHGKNYTNESGSFSGPDPNFTGQIQIKIY
jgi:hypothetical protein